MSFRAAIKANDGATAVGLNFAFSLAGTGAVAGDACVVEIILNSTTPTVTTLAGWTLLSGPDDNTAGNRMYLFGKILDATDISNGSFTFVSSANGRGSGSGAIVSNPSGAPFGTPVKTTQSGTIASVTTTAGGSVTLYFIGSTVASGTPADLTMSIATKDAQAKTANASGVNTTSAVGHRQATTVTSYGGGTMTGQGATFQTYAIEVKQGAATMDAGPDQGDVEPGVTVTLDSSGSTGLAGGRTWTQFFGPTVALSSTSAVSPTFTAPPSLDGATLFFRVTDNLGGTFDEVAVIVLPSSRRVKLGGSMVPTYKRVTLS